MGKLRDRLLASAPGVRPLLGVSLLILAGGCAGTDDTADKAQELPAEASGGVSGDSEVAYPRSAAAPVESGPAQAEPTATEPAAGEPATVAPAPNEPNPAAVEPTLPVSLDPRPTPAAPAPDEPAPAQPSTPTPAPAAADGEVEFIPWESFANTNAGGGLSGPLEVRDVSDNPSFESDDLMVAFVGDDGNNRVIGIDVDSASFHEHTLGFACGDCRISATLVKSVIATSSAVYASDDRGGSSYTEIGAVAFSSEQPLSSVHAFDGQIWLQADWEWLSIPMTGGTPTPAAWSTVGIESVSEDAALEVNTRTIALHSAAGDQATNNPCTAYRKESKYGLSMHLQTSVFVACGDNTMAAGSVLPDGEFEIWELDSPVQWIGPLFAATETSWYSVGGGYYGLRVGVQAPLQDGEVVYGHMAGTRLAFRVTNLGIASSYVGLPLDPPASEL